MMEEFQTIFAVGAGAVTKLVKFKDGINSEAIIMRLFRPKYPYEYLAEEHDEGVQLRREKNKEKIFEFFAEEA